jgi:uncharacterized protein (TIGR01777 family)
MPHFQKSTDLPASIEKSFAWHEAPGAIQRLIPPWERVRVDNHSGGLEVGKELNLVNKLGPIPLRWHARHTAYDPPFRFADTQLSGPFKRWDHDHRFHATSDHLCRLTDSIEYTLPGGPLGNALLGGWIRGKLEQMFHYRHVTTAADLALHQLLKKDIPMRVLVTGASGLLGSTLKPLLTTGGHDVIRMGREKSNLPDVITWNPAKDQLDKTKFENFDAVVHLAGENIAGARWNPEVKSRIRDSRVKGTRFLCEELAKLKKKPEVLVCASAIGFYGNRGDEQLTEQSPAGTGFLADVCKEWEAAAQPARDAGIRVVHLRFGMILSPKEGALAKMLLPFKMGAGGVVGSGKQYWSWVSVDDAASMCLFAISKPELNGPVNAVAPQTVTNAEFTKVLGRVLSRPTIVPMPAFGAKMALGEMAEALILSSARVVPAVLEQSQFPFRHPTLEVALRALLGKVKIAAA